MYLRCILIVELMGLTNVLVMCYKESEEEGVTI